MSILMSIIVCLFVATVTRAAYTDQIQQDSLTPARNPNMVLFSLCWDGRDFLDDCQKHSTLVKQLLYKLLHKIKTDSRQSEGDLYTEEEDRLDTSRQAKKRQPEDPSGFYSNW